MLIIKKQAVEIYDSLKIIILPCPYSFSQPVCRAYSGIGYCLPIRGLCG